VARYAPDRGELVWLDFDSQAGHEQAGKRPALILSPKAYNQRTSLALIAPVTNRIKRYPFEVRLEGCKTTGCVLADQVRSLDWSARKAKRIEAAPREVIEEVIDKLAVLLLVK
jgi:mRNA interferase MazF